MMARYTVVVLSVIAVSVELVSCCFSGGSDIPRSRSGEPFGVDINGNTEVFPTYDSDSGAVGVAVQVRFRRRRSTDNSLQDKDASRMLFDIFDLNQDGQIDVVDWTKEGGKLVSFSDLIVASDIDGDEKLSLEEFLQVPILPDLGLGLGLGRDDVTPGGEGTLSPAQD